MVKFHSLKATINYPFGNGNHTTYKNGDDWGMVASAQARFFTRGINQLISSAERVVDCSLMLLAPGGLKILDKLRPGSVCV